MNFTVLELEYKKLLCIAFIGSEQIIQLNNLRIKILTKDNLSKNEEFLAI